VAATALAFAAGAATPDIVAAAMAEAAAPEGDASDADGEPEIAVDPIARRIVGATEVAALAAAGEDAEDVGRLVEMAHQRSATDLVAEPRAAAEETAAEGWQIQLAAVATQQDAEDILAGAEARMGEALASLRPFTQAVERDGETLYRARFAGFDGKEEARRTCAALKRQAIDCLAVPN
jgi:hypothetical protein